MLFRSDVAEDVAGFFKVAGVAVLGAVALIQKAVPLLRDAHDIDALPGDAHLVVHKAGGEPVLREGHLLDALAGVALGVTQGRSISLMQWLGRMPAIWL